MAAEAPKWRETAKKALHKTLDKEKALAILGRQAADDVRMTITSGGTSKESSQSARRSRWSSTGRGRNQRAVRARAAGTFRQRNRSS